MDSSLTEQPVPNQPLPDLVSDEFAELYQTHSREIYYLALRFLSDAHQAEDATHDVFVKAYRKWNTFRGESSYRTWLYRIAINHCCNLRQSWANRKIQGQPEWKMKNPKLQVPSFKEAPSLKFQLGWNRLGNWNRNATHEPDS